MGLQNVRCHRILVGFVSIAFLLLVVGCSGGTPTSSSPPKEKAPPAVKSKAPPPKVPATPGGATPGGPIPGGATPGGATPGAPTPGAEKKEEKEYTYNPSGKGDPFKPFIQLGRAPTGSRPLSPLQQYDLSQLKLVAIISAPEGNIALVEDASGKGFFLRRGTDIGKNDGKVTKILKDRVIVEENSQDVLGQTKKSEVELVLQRPEEGEKP